MKSIEDEKVAQSSQGAKNRAIPKSVTQNEAHEAQPKSEAQSEAQIEAQVRI